MNIEQIKTEWARDSEIDQLNIGSESLKNAKLHSKYVNELADWKILAADKQNDYNMLRKVKFRYYRGELSKDELTKYGLVQYQGPKHLKNEMNEILDGDMELCQCKNEVESAQIAISLLESIIKSIFSRGFDIKNYIDYEKFRSGY